MASLTRYSKGYKVRYRVYYPDGANRVAFAYRSTQREALRLKGQAESLESITSQNALTPETAIPFRAPSLAHPPGPAGLVSQACDAQLRSARPDTRIRVRPVTKR